jgi:hypothetical protein
MHATSSPRRILLNSTASHSKVVERANSKGLTQNGKLVGIDMDIMKQGKVDKQITLFDEYRLLPSQSRAKAVNLLDERGSILEL